jgi:hypothetical protein
MRFKNKTANIRRITKRDASNSRKARINVDNTATAGTATTVGTDTKGTLTAGGT